MTYNQIVDPYLKSLGYHRNRDSMSVEIVFPHIIMAKHWDIFKERIADAPISHKALQMRNLWEKTYKDFNDSLWRCYYKDPIKKTLTDEGFAISDFCSAFSAYIEHHTFIAKIAVMNALMDAGKSDYEQQIISDCYLCNALAKASSTVYGRVYRTPRGQERKCHEIETIIRCTRDLSKGMGNTVIPIEDRRQDVIEDAVSILVKKTVHWLFNEANEVLKDYE